jgi:hypothetical protein
MQALLNSLLNMPRYHSKTRLTEDDHTFVTLDTEPESDKVYAR